MTSGAPGIRRIEAIHYYVHDLERSRRFFTTKLDFAEVGRSGAALEESGRQRALVFEAGACRVVCSTPSGAGGRADRFLRKHPDGVGSIVFEVTDIERLFSSLEAARRHADRRHPGHRGAGRPCKTFVLATPFGDTTFRFVERDGYVPALSRLRAYATPVGGTNASALHARSRHQQLRDDVAGAVVDGARARLRALLAGRVPHRRRGPARGRAGLGSAVGGDVGSASGVKFANNEPYRPSFKASQINVFHEEHRGDGVQHVALAVTDIVARFAACARAASS